MKDGINWRRYAWILTSLTGAAALATYCTSCALDINDKLGFMWVGRSATVTFFVLGMTKVECKSCNSKFSLWNLVWKKGYCPSCGEKIPVSDYCPRVPDRRWWRLFQGAPLGLKMSAVFLILLGCMGALHFLLAGLPILMAESRGEIVHGIALYVVLLVMFFHMLKTVVRGAIPYVCIIALGALGWGVADSFREFLVVFVPLMIFLLPFLTTASRRWGRNIKEEDLAYWIAARSGAFPFWRMVAKCALKKVTRTVLLFVCLGAFAYSTKSIEIMCDRVAALVWTDLSIR